MSLLKMLGGGEGISRLASQLNMDPEKANGLAGMLAPAIGSAAKKRAESGDLGGVLGQLRGEGNARFFDEPETAAEPEARADGENFLEQLLGSREARDELAATAAERAGVDRAEADQFMPALAAMLKGGMQKQTPDSSIDGMLSQLTGGGGGGGGLMGMVGSLLGGGQSGGGGLDVSSISKMLDADGDGSPLDDILERVMK